MSRTIKIADKRIGTGMPTFVIAEIGINHNGSLDIARQLIDVAAESGCDAVKFQKRDPDLCVPPEMRDKMRETPWGYITYLEYRRHIEFGLDEFQALDHYCRANGMLWFSSCWDEPSVDFMAQFDTPCIKIPSAALTHRSLLEKTLSLDCPIMLSTGMSTMQEIRSAVNLLGSDRLLLAHATSTYPCPVEELNLRMVQTLASEFDCPIGYSGHETGLMPTVASVALGASFVERHITLDRAMWGSDQSASVEPVGLRRLVKDIRVVDRGLGDGIKKVYDSESVSRSRLRRVNDLPLE
jgi:N-acetylneuraminate synthase